MVHCMAPQLSCSNPLSLFLKKHDISKWRSGDTESQIWNHTHRPFRSGHPCAPGLHLLRSSGQSSQQAMVTWDHPRAGQQPKHGTCSDNRRWSEMVGLQHSLVRTARRGPMHPGAKVRATPQLSCGCVWRTVRMLLGNAIWGRGRVHSSSTSCWQRRSSNRGFDCVGCANLRML